MIGSNNVVNNHTDIKDLSDAIFKVAKTIRIKQPKSYIISLVNKKFSFLYKLQRFKQNFN